MVQLDKSDTFFAFLITEKGIVTEPIISRGKTRVGLYDYGQIKFSPDGTMVAVSNSRKGVDLFQFNSKIGTLSNPVEITTGGLLKDTGTLYHNGYPIEDEKAQWLEFAPNSNYLYVNHRSGSCVPGESLLCQYDLSLWNTTSINNSLIRIAQSSENFGMLQLASDGRIYMGGRSAACDRSAFLDVIKHPNTRGADCSFEEDAVNLGGKEVWQGLPNFVQSYFRNI